MSGPAARRTPPARRALFLAIVALVALVLVEAGLRGRAWIDDRRQERALAALDGTSAPPADSTASSLADLVRLSRWPRIIYELRPGLVLTHGGRRLTVNPEGFRGPSLERVPAPGTVRVVGLGDSVMFGWRMGDEQLYLRLLEKELRATGDVRWEILNAAVPGYNTAMEVETLRRRALDYAPDLVLLHYIGNDTHLPNFIRADADYLALDRSFLLELLLRRGRRAPARGLVDTPREGRGFLADPRRVPTRYADMVGLDGVRRALGELGELARERGFAVLFLHHDGVRAEIPDAARAQGFHVMRLGDREQLAALARLTDGRATRHEDLLISEADPHPSALGHAVLADALARELERSGLRARLEEAAREALDRQGTSQAPVSRR